MLLLLSPALYLGAQATLLGRGWPSPRLPSLGGSSWHYTETLCLVKDIRGGTDRQGRKFILQRVWCWPEVVEGSTVPEAEGLGRVSISVTTLLRKCGLS